MQLHAEPRDERIHGDLLYALDPDELVEIVLPPRAATEVVADRGSAVEAFAGAVVLGLVSVIAGGPVLALAAIAMLARGAAFPTRSD